MGSGGTTPPLLTSALDGGQWSASRFCHITSRERVPSALWIRDCVGPRDGLDVLALALAENRTSVVQRIARRYPDSQLPVGSSETKLYGVFKSGSLLHAKEPRHKQFMSFPLDW
jgi:hypothetical protein